MEIKVNDYVRTDKGNISKIKWISQHITTLNETKAGIFHLENGEIVQMHYGDIIKSSPNIIDLIEVGDYVNGMLVRHIAYLDGKEKNLMFTDNCEVSSVTNDYVIDKNIKSIVTKEMFEQMEYKLEKE